MRYFILIGMIFTIGLFNANALENANDTLNHGMQFNTVNISAGFFPVWGVMSFNYERKIKEKRTGLFKAYYLKGSGGKWSTFGGVGHLAELGFSGLTGVGRNHFEIHLGATSIIQTERYHREKDYPDNFPDQQPVLLKNYIKFWPAGSLGYRYQKPGNPFLFRTGIGFPDAVYMSLGLAF